MRVSSSQQSINFQAIPLAQWRCNSANNKSIKQVTIVSLERRDKHFVEEFQRKFATLFGSNKDDITNSIIKDTINTIVEILKSEEMISEKVRVLMAVYNSKPCGLLIANMPKSLKDGSIVHSSRHNCAKNETEIDWLATWVPKREKKILGVGKSLLGEYFRTVKKDKFRDVFVRSELPENSIAQYFYESMGFEQIGKKRTLLSTKTSNNYLINNYAEATDEVVPMLITRKVLNEKKDSLAIKMCRQEFVNKSVAIEDLVILN